jgi:hypothetical protein
MPSYRANLDALIPREDFEVREDSGAGPSQLADALKVSDLEPKNWTLLTLCKPDFQRETADWEPEKVVDLVKSFLDGDLIPSIILWRAPESGKVFVIDGAHRLSAFIAWVHDDYGDGTISREFFSNMIPPEQRKAAEKARDLMKRDIGSYADLKAALTYVDTSPEEKVKRARNASAFGVSLQWVRGDAKKAEQSFFKINQKATLIDPIEFQMIQSRRKPNAIAARALIRAGVGHKYWSALPLEAQRDIETISREIYETLFTPALETPIKTLDLPVAGRGYSAETVRLLFDFVNLANNISLRQKKQTPLEADDKDGNATVSFLKNVRRIAFRISGTHHYSLGLHPAVYFYGATGRYQPTAFLATALLIKDLEQRDLFIKFTEHRDKFEEFLLAHRYFTNQTVTKFGSGVRGHDWVFRLYKEIFERIAKGEIASHIVAALQKNTDFNYLVLVDNHDGEKGGDFSTETKSAAFLRSAIESAVRCSICHARMHVKSMTVDHVTAKSAGGSASVDNAQMAHPFCNTGYKEHKKTSVDD